MIAGLETPDSGSIYINDKVVNNVPPRERNIALVFQSYALYPLKTVYENIAFPLRVRKVPRDEIEKRVKYVAELLHINHLLERKPAQLDVGERQRVALGRALVREVDVLLLDEPLTNLDAKLRVEMRGELKRLQKEMGATVICVTHDQSEAMAMADRIAVMNSGKIQQEGSPQDIYENPKNLFVAGFIGSPSMNFINCSLNERDGKFYLVAQDFEYDITELAEQIKLSTDQELVLGIRPEHISISKKPIDENSIKAKIWAIEPTGHRMFLDLQIGEINLKVNTRQSKIKEGETVWVNLPVEKIRVYDRKTGELIL
jgi:ABC-type sugar transport system ATPase subunit